MNNSDNQITYHQIRDTIMKQTTPTSEEFHLAVAKAISTEQIQNWISNDNYCADQNTFLGGFDEGKLYVSQALVSFLKKNFPCLEDEEIAIVLGTETEPTLDIEFPEWFSWEPDGGEPLPIEEDNVISITS